MEPTGLEVIAGIFIDWCGRQTLTETLTEVAKNTLILPTRNVIRTRCQRLSDAPALVNN